MLYEVRPPGTSVMTGEASKILWEMLSVLEEKRRVEIRYGRVLSDMNSPLAVIQDPGVRIRFVNAAFLKLFGFTAEQVLGKPYGELLDEEYRQRDLGYCHARITGKTAPEEYETRLRQADGSFREVIIRARPSDWDGRPASLAMINDVSELRHLQRERERFFRFMVHELRAPVTPLVTAVSLLKDPRVLEDPERRDKLAPLIIRSTERLQEFVDDFLQLSRLDQETLALSQHDVDLRAVIMDIVENQRILAEQKGLALDAAPWQEVPIRGDTFVLRTLVQNLLNNAIKYTDQGGAKVSVSRDEGMFTVSVTDTGAGLTEEEQAHHFQEFGRIQRTAGLKGTGLGLALVKKLVQECSGRVWVESEGKGKGSTFSVSLPYLFGNGTRKD